MTVSSSARTAGPFYGNGVTTVFPFTFKVFSASDLQITRTTAAGVASVITSGFTVTLNADQDASPGGSITYPISGSPMASLESLVAVGALPYQQGLDLTNVSRFLPQAIEDGLDYQNMLIQQLLASTGRQITIPADGPYPVTALPYRQARYDKLLSFDPSTGQPMVTAFTQTQVASVVAAIYTAAAGPLDALTFIQAGTGAVARTAQNKARDQLSVKDFGAVGNGVTDDTAAIQAAIDAAWVGSSSTSGNKTVLIPGGVYLTSNSLVLKDYATIVGAGRFQTIIKCSLVGKSAIRSQYGESPTIGQRPSGMEVRGLQIYSPTITAGSVGVNLKNAQYSGLRDIFIAGMDTGVVSDQILQYCYLHDVNVQVSNVGASLASTGGGNHILNCDFAGNTLPLDIFGGAWDLSNVSIETLNGAAAAVAWQIGRPGGFATVVHASNIYIEGTSNSTLMMQIENSVTEASISVHKHGTLGDPVNNAGDAVLVEVPGQGIYTPRYLTQRVAFAGSISGTERASIISESGNAIAMRNALNNGYAYTYAHSLYLKGPVLFGEAGTITLGAGTSGTVGAAGGASALPATPLGYMQAYVGTTLVKFPYYSN